jgi:hypothetical protein
MSICRMLTSLAGTNLRKSGSATRLCFMLIASIVFLHADAQNSKIKVYFNRSVNTAVSAGTNAVYLPYTMQDTIAAYINRAKYTVDIAQYDYSASSMSSKMAVIATACNNAKTRGVVVRWIYDGSQTNTGLALLNSAIGKAASPVATGYIMHDKFVVIDVNSANTSDAYVVNGTNDWSVTNTDTCYNNLVVIQDKNVANDYYLEFNKMWGGTGPTPTPANAKWGTAKTASTTRNYNVNGTAVEVYFSPKDTLSKHLINTINTTNSEVCFGIYTFTDNGIASALKTLYQTPGITGFGMIDSYSKTNTPYTTLSAVMGANLKVYTGPDSYNVYHNKTAIIDPLTPGSDPTVWTGSYNWTGAGTNSNDENAMVIHDANITNQYYQSFCHNFTDLGGAACPNLATSIADPKSVYEPFAVFPNPVGEELTFSPDQIQGPVQLRVFDCFGKLVLEKDLAQAVETKLNFDSFAAGMYVLHVTTEQGAYFRKLIRR